MAGMAQVLCGSALDGRIRGNSRRLRGSSRSDMLASQETWASESSPFNAQFYVSPGLLSSGPLSSWQHEARAAVCCFRGEGGRDAVGGLGPGPWAKKPVAGACSQAARPAEPHISLPGAAAAQRREARRRTGSTFAGQRTRAGEIDGPKAYGLPLVYVI